MGILMDIFDMMPSFVPEDDDRGGNLGTSGSESTGSYLPYNPAPVYEPVSYPSFQMPVNQFIEPPSLNPVLSGAGSGLVTYESYAERIEYLRTSHVETTLSALPDVCGNNYLRRRRVETVYERLVIERWYTRVIDY